jgi:hypothetical protein
MAEIDEVWRDLRRLRNHYVHALSRFDPQPYTVPMRILADAVGAQPDSELAQRAFVVAWFSDGDAGQSTSTSVRLPHELHAIAKELVAAGWASSLTDLLVAGVRREIGELAVVSLGEDGIADVRAALEEHYATHPDARPTLAMIVVAAAQQEGHPAAEHPEIVDDAIADLGEDAFIEDVLAWVRGALAHGDRAAAADR